MLRRILLWVLLILGAVLLRLSLRAVAHPAPSAARPAPAPPTRRARRQRLGSALVMVGVVSLALCFGTVAYAQWTDWQARLDEPAGPLEALPERFEIGAIAALDQESAIDAEQDETAAADAETAAEYEAVTTEASLAGNAVAITAEPRPAAARPADAGDRAILPTMSSTASATLPSPAIAAPASVEPTSTGGSDPDELWSVALSQVDAAWESDWPRVIAILDEFRARQPDHPAAVESLYGALFSYGELLAARGEVAEGISLLERARDLLPERGEAIVALRRLAAPPSYGRPVRIDIPRIGVNSRVSDVTAPWGEYQIPAHAVGFHADSAEPGQGNSVFNGHLTSLNAGRVFARLHELRAGDAVYVYTDTHRLDWVVHGWTAVEYTEDSFIDPSDDVRITLYTCTGQYIPIYDNYTHRLVVVGGLVSVNARS